MELVTKRSAPAARSPVSDRPPRSAPSVAGRLLSRNDRKTRQGPRAREGGKKTEKKERKRGWRKVKGVCVWGAFQSRKEETWEHLTHDNNATSMTSARETGLVIQERRELSPDSPPSVRAHPTTGQQKYGTYNRTTTQSPTSDNVHVHSRDSGLCGHRMQWGGLCVPARGCRRIRVDEIEHSWFVGNWVVLY